MHPITASGERKSRRITNKKRIQNDINNCGRTTYKYCEHKKGEIDDGYQWIGFTVIDGVFLWATGESDALHVWPVLGLSRAGKMTKCYFSQYEF